MGNKIVKYNNFKNMVSPSETSVEKYAVNDLVVFGYSHKHNDFYYISRIVNIPKELYNVVEVYILDKLHYIDDISGYPIKRGEDVNIHIGMIEFKVDTTNVINSGLVDGTLDSIVEVNNSRFKVVSIVRKMKDNKLITFIGEKEGELYTITYDDGMDAYVVVKNI